jgi:unconventional prefoldin RPB5 interactor 1
MSVTAKESGLKPLIYVQSRDHRVLSDKIADFESKISEYDSLIEKLSTVDSRVKHDVMVPIGKVAFIPGRLVHTNEVYVNLGADFIALRSAKQAVKLAEQRRERLCENLKMLTDGRRLTEDWQKTAETLGDEFMPEVRTCFFEGRCV